jgi:hypothetical protein
MSEAHDRTSLPTSSSSDLGAPDATAALRALDGEGPHETHAQEWRLLIDEVADQLDQWERYLDEPSVDSLPIGGLPALPTGAVPSAYRADIAEIARRIEPLAERLNRRAGEVSGEIEQVRRVRAAAATYSG